MASPIGLVAARAGSYIDQIGVPRNEAAALRFPTPGDLAKAVNPRRST